jgi:hypothetical protein
MRSSPPIREPISKSIRTGPRRDWRPAKGEGGTFASSHGAANAGHAITYPFNPSCATPQIGVVPVAFYRGLARVAAEGSGFAGAWPVGLGAIVAEETGSLTGSTTWTSPWRTAMVRMDLLNRLSRAPTSLWLPARELMDTQVTQLVRDGLHKRSDRRTTCRNG